MDILDQYVIPLKGLKEGEHHYTFEVTKKFFEHFEHSEIKNGNISVNIILNKTASVIEMIINLLGKVEVICDRCLETFMMPINSSDILYIKFKKG